MLGNLPIEIAKLIHVYVFEDVLKELLRETTQLRNWNDNNKNNENFYVHMRSFGGWRWDIIYLIGIVIECNVEFFKKKLNFLIRHNKETMIICRRCRHISSICEYKEDKSVWNILKGKCVHI